MICPRGFDYYGRFRALKSCNGVIDIVVECGGAVSDAPSGVRVRGFLPIIHGQALVNGPLLPCPIIKDMEIVGLCVEAAVIFTAQRVPE